MVCIQWNVQSESIILTKDDGSTLIITVGEFITYNGREGGVRVESFLGKNAEGPSIMEYLPWRGMRWATYSFSLRGNTRIIICPPIGIPHYGEHIDWNTVLHINDGICPV